MTKKYSVNKFDNEILIYQTEDGKTRVDVRLDNDTVWLNLNQLANLFQRDKSVISKHIKKIYEEGELVAEATVANFATVQAEGKREISRSIEYYNLDVIISVGYRVKSHRGTQFRIWATQRLKEYLIKGFALDDHRLKQANSDIYFEELLARIRDIRSSEKVFWRKILDIYSTSIDYDPTIELSQQFFRVVQNKMHWAVHGRTAAELIAERVDANKTNMGLTSWSGVNPSKSDCEVAKNYLTHNEIEVLNRLVTMYLEFAELQALQRRPMYMRDWIVKLDDFLKISDHEILSHAGNISHQQAIEKAHAEYEKYAKLKSKKLSLVEQHFLDAIKEIERLKKNNDQ